ncbi:MAG: hypothetical protein ACE5EL_08685 [Anaerolineae bacterium]
MKSNPNSTAILAAAPSGGIALARQRAVFAAAAALVAVALAGAMLAARGPVRFGSGAPAASGGYPPPAPSATTVPGPDANGIYPPPGVPHQVISRSESPYARLLADLESALASRDPAAFSAWVDDAGAGLTLEYPGRTEGFGTRLDPASTAALLQDLFDAASAPVVQGYFEQAGCDHSNPGEACWPLVLVTGLKGPVAMPTKDPTETLGPPVPAELPVGAAAWELFDDPTGPYWMAWWLGDGYYSLVDRLADLGLGTYFVVR